MTGVYNINPTLVKNIKTIYGITDEEIKQFSKSFQSTDKDKDGLIMKGDLANILNFHNLGIERQALHEFAKEIRYTNDKFVTIDEYIKVIYYFI